MKDSVRTDCQMYAKDFCGDDGIILFLGITASLAFRTIIAYSNHIPQEFSTSMSWSSRHSTIIWLLHHILRNFQDGNHVERTKANFV